jgi:hypothetical protein
MSSRVRRMTPVSTSIPVRYWSAMHRITRKPHLIKGQGQWLAALANRRGDPPHNELTHLNAGAP